MVKSEVWNVNAYDYSIAFCFVANLKSYFHEEVAILAILAHQFLQRVFNA